MVNSAVNQAGAPGVLGSRVAVIEFSLENLFRAYWMNHTGGPGWKGTGSSKEIINPLQWYRWAYIRMSPCNDQRVFGTTVVPDTTALYNWFCQWQLFKHLKTDFRVLNTDVRSSNETRIVASLLVQDSYWQVSNRNVADIQNIKYPTFTELSAWGAQWSFPPGQKSVDSRSFNHHSMFGTNDPIGEPWKVFCPLDSESQNETEIGFVFGTLFLAEFATVTNKAYGGGETVALEMEQLSDTWALIKVRSEWLLGNQNRVKGNAVAFSSSIG